MIPPVCGAVLSGTPRRSETMSSSRILSPDIRSGQPSLLGTYQGYGYPEDDELNYTANVDVPFAEEYASYRMKTGRCRSGMKNTSLQHDAAKASYRLHAWAEKDLKSLLVSYGILKPKTIINGVFTGTGSFMCR